MDKLKKLLSMCKCGFFLTINEHRDYFQTVQDYLSEADNGTWPPNIDQDIRDGMLEAGTVIKLQFYPDNPSSSFVIYHYDLDMALNEAMACFDA